MDAASRPECLPGTRVKILRSITEWLLTPPSSPTDPSPDAGSSSPLSSKPDVPFPNLNTPLTGPNVLWLTGMAGSGKSTIATTIASQFLTLRRRGAFLHFNRNDPDNSAPNAVVRTLSHQLSLFHPRIRAAVSKQLEETPGLETASIATQFEKLLLQPLAELKSLDFLGPIIIILDALDECGEASSRGDLLDVLRDGLSSLPPLFRILITSRSEFDIQPSLSMPNVTEMTIDTSDTDSDIELYFQNSLNKLRFSHPSLPKSMNDRNTVLRLVNQAGGLFIWASTAIKFIGQNPQIRLPYLLSQSSKRAPQDRLDELYKTALEVDAFSSPLDEEAEFYQSVLGAIVIARIPMTDELIDQMLPSSKYSAGSFLDHIQCLFYRKPGEPIRALHASVLDYLSDSSRSGTRPWFVDISVHHYTFAKQCFAIMVTDLHFNINGFETSFRGHGTPKKSTFSRWEDNSEDKDEDESQSGEGLSASYAHTLTPLLAYATKYWADHVSRAVVAHDTEGLSEMRGGRAQSLHMDVDGFMSYRFLYWLEALSVLDAIPQAPSILWVAVQWVRVSLINSSSGSETDYYI